VYFLSITNKVFCYFVIVTPPGEISVDSLFMLLFVFRMDPAWELIRQEGQMGEYFIITFSGRFLLPIFQKPKLGMTYSAFNNNKSDNYPNIFFR
jgi:hypothetical protein